MVDCLRGIGLVESAGISSDLAEPVAVLEDSATTRGGKCFRRGKGGREGGSNGYIAAICIRSRIHERRRCTWGYGRWIWLPNHSRGGSIGRSGRWVCGLVCGRGSRSGSWRSARRCCLQSLPPSQEFPAAHTMRNILGYFKKPTVFVS